MSISLLTYARHHGLACDYLANDPTHLINDLIKEHIRQKDGQISSEVGMGIEESNQIHNDFVAAMLKERMTISLDHTRHLQNAIMASDLTHLPSSERWLLPDRLHAIQSLKLKPPMLVLGDGLAGTQRDIDRVKKGLDIEGTMCSIKEDYTRTKRQEQENKTKAATTVVSSSRARSTSTTAETEPVEAPIIPQSEVAAWMLHYDECSEAVWQKIKSEKPSLKKEVLLNLQEALRKRTE